MFHVIENETFPAIENVTFLETETGTSPETGNEIFPGTENEIFLEIETETFPGIGSESAMSLVRSQEKPQIGLVYRKLSQLRRLLQVPLLSRKPWIAAVETRCPMKGSLPMMNPTEGEDVNGPKHKDRVNRCVTGIILERCLETGRSRGATIGDERNVHERNARERNAQELLNQQSLLSLPSLPSLRALMTFTNRCFSKSCRGPRTVNATMKLASLIVRRNGDDESESVRAKRRKKESGNWNKTGKILNRR